MTADVLRKKLQRLEDRLTKIGRIAAPELSAFVANEQRACGPPRPLSRP